jgi:predicted metal-dependent hydrolase
MEAARLPELPPFSVRRSDRARRSRLTITDQGVALVVLPARAPEAEAHELIRRHRRWIAIHTGRILSQRAALAARPQIGAGREVPLRGELRRVVSIAAIDGRTRPAVRLVDSSIVITSAPFEERSAADILDGWLRGEARRDIEARLAVRSTEMGLHAKRITIRDQKTRWGSASRKGTLSFSWRLVMCPPWVLDYVVVHELAHLKIGGHPPSFWRLVERYVPASRAARRWLQDHHDEIVHALD